MRFRPENSKKKITEREMGKSVKREDGPNKVERAKSEAVKRKRGTRDTDKPKKRKQSPKSTATLASFAVGCSEDHRRELEILYTISNP